MKPVIWLRLRRGALLWGPVFLVMLAIFIASAQPGIDPANRPTGSVRVSGLMPFLPGQWDVLLKKSGHIVAYAALGLLLVRALHRSHIRLTRACLLAALIAMSYAATDELHQAFVPYRGSSVIDLGIDLVGVTVGILLAHRALTRHSHPESIRAPHWERAMPSSRSR